jgi:ABC-type uncharacterized transport system substrate-binding protein
MHRRRLLAVALAAPLAPRAVWAANVRRVGVLADIPGPHWQVFQQALARLGHKEGAGLTLEWRWANGQIKRFPALAAELVKLKVDIIVAEGTPAIRAAKTATSDIPIVMAISADPVGTGFVQSLTRPGGNVTGSSSRSPELYAKQMELLKEVIPNLGRVGLLWHPGSPASRIALKEVEAAASVLKIELLPVEARDTIELPGAFQALGGKRPHALIVMATPTFDGLQAQIADLSTSAGLPAVYNKSAFAQAGGLFSYGARYSEFFRRAAQYVDRVLKGARPADLPV